MSLREQVERSFSQFTFLDPATHHMQARRLFATVMAGLDDSLAPLAVDTACLASITAHDAGAHEAGHSYALEAVDIAERSHRPDLTARAAGMASIHLSASHGTAPNRRGALRYLQGAREGAGSGVVRVWANLFTAIEHAAGGERRACVAALNTADRNLGRGSGHGFFSEQGYLRSFNSPARLAGTTGRCLAMLGDAPNALAELGSALALPDLDGRYTLVLYVDSVLAYVAADEAEMACDAAAVALDACREAGYQLGIDRLRSIRASFPDHWATLPCVHELDERLRLV